MKTIKVSTQPKADTKRLKVADLPPGPQMDVLVAEARGWKSGLEGAVWIKSDSLKDYVFKSDYNPSGNGGQCFELIEEFDIWLSSDSPCMDNVEANRSWIASTKTTHVADEEWMHGEGSTPEIAICRAVISSAFGEEVSLSDDNVASRFGETVEVEE